MKKNICLLILSVLAMGLYAAAPVVTNVIADPQPGHVVITYNLSHADNLSCNVTVEVSADGGANYTIIPTALSGDVGLIPATAAGADHQIIWYPSQDNVGMGDNYRIKIIADDNYAEFHENVIHVTSLSNLSEPLVEGSTYTFSYTGTPPDVCVGDILIGSTGLGFMRKVLSVQNTSDQIICQTDYALLTDVFAECSFMDSVQVSLGDIKNGEKGIHIESEILYTGYDADLSVSDIDIDFDPVVVFGTNITGSMLDSVFLGLSGPLSQQMTVDFEVRAGINIHGGVVIWQGPQFTVASIYGVPVVGCIQVVAGFDAVWETIGEESWTVESNHDLSIGIPIFNFSGSILPPVPIVDHELESVSITPLDHVTGNSEHVKLYIYPRVALMVASCLGPTFGLQPYYKYENIEVNNSWQATSSFGAALKASIALDFWVFEIADLGLSLDIFETIIDQYPDPSIAPPTFDPPAGTYNAPIDVVLSCSTPGAQIRYTVNGGIPTHTSPLYTVPIHISETSVVKAKAYKDYLVSDTAYASYSIETTVATPTFFPMGATYDQPLNIFIFCDTPDATIRYTTDGTEPNESSTEYLGTIYVATSMTIKAKGYKANLTPSPTATTTYTINSSWITDWSDSFDTYTLNQFPPNWTGSGNVNGIFVSNYDYVSPPYALSMAGVSGGNWEACIHRQFDNSHNNNRFDFKYYFTGQGQVGNHNDHGEIFLSTGPSWTSSLRSMLAFKPNGEIWAIYGGTYQIIGTYNLNAWVDMAIEYTRNPTTVTLKYYRDGILIHQGNADSYVYESNLSYFSPMSGDTRCLFDDISVSYR